MGLWTAKQIQGSNLAHTIVSATYLRNNHRVTRLHLLSVPFILLQVATQRNRIAELVLESSHRFIASIWPEATVHTYMVPNC